MIRPYPVGSVITLKNRKNQRYTISSYNYERKFIQGNDTFAITYKVTSEQGYTCHFDHDVILDCDRTSIMCIDDLLILYQEYKELHNNFGDNTYLNKLIEIESILKSKIHRKGVNR